MKLNFLNSGIDSLKKGFENLNKYESINFSNSSAKSKEKRFYYLKDAILFIQHGIEVLFKSIITRHSEYLIFSQIDSNVKKALLQKKQRNLNSVFESDLKNKIHTVTFLESIERLKIIPTVEISKSLEKRLKELESYRNIIMHSEPHLNEYQINITLDGLSDDLDIFFINNIGAKYKTISGYSSLIKNMSKFKTLLAKKELELKTYSIDTIIKALKHSNISIGSNEVKRITNLNSCTKFLTEIFASDLVFGTDLYNGYCSGRVTKIKRKTDNIFEMFTADNNAYFEFKLKSIIINIPKIVSEKSPIIFIESDNIEFDEKIWKKEYLEEYREIKSIHYYQGKENKEIVYSGEIDDDDDEFEYEEFDSYVRFLTKGIYCFLNIHGLEYNRNYAKLVEELRAMNGKRLEVELRENILE
ncbi:MAG: hypothetical protein HRT67_04410 [Flavobacteriaceae bacterium]|nr:hypothetical protein [Flavobacteriaceae bacterium]